MSDKRKSKFIDTICRQCKIKLSVIKLSDDNICPDCIAINQRKTAKATIEDYKIMYRI